MVFERIFHESAESLVLGIPEELLSCLDCRNGRPFCSAESRYCLFTGASNLWDDRFGYSTLWDRLPETLVESQARNRLGGAKVKILPHQRRRGAIERTDLDPCELFVVVLSGGDNGDKASPVFVDE